MQKYRFPSGREGYLATEVEAALAAKDARIAELCQRLDQVHALALASDVQEHVLQQEIANLTIGYGPAGSHKVVE